VIGDLDSPDGFRVVKDALKHLQSDDCSAHLGFIHAPTTDTRISTGHSASTVLHELISMSALRTITAEEVLDLLEHWNEGEASTRKKAGGPQSPLGHVHIGFQPHSLTGWGKGQDSHSTWKKAGIEIARKLGIDTNKPHLIINGRVSHKSETDPNNQVVGPLSDSTFAAEDFAPLEMYEYRKRVKPVVDLLKTVYEDITKFDRATLADLVSSISSVLTTAYKSDEGESIFVAPPTSRSRYYESLDKGIMYVYTNVKADVYRSFHVGDLDTAIVRVAAVIDPISEEAQVWSTLLKTASEMDNVSVSVYLEPDIQNTEVRTVKRSKLISS
jgi:UDP-glucose:glycoprotein glucosyltransferase